MRNVLTVFVTVIMAAGCSGVAVESAPDAGESVVDAGVSAPDAGVSAPDAGAPDAAQECGAPDTTLAWVDEVAVAADYAGPAFEGGEIPSGTYTLTSITQFTLDGGAAGPTGRRVQNRIVVNATNWGETVRTPDFTMVAAGGLHVTDHVVRFFASCPGPDWNADGVFTWQDGDWLFATSTAGGQLVISRYAYAP